MKFEENHTMSKVYLFALVILTVLLVYLVPQILEDSRDQEFVNPDAAPVDGFSWAQLIIVAAVALLFFMFRIHIVADENELRVKFFPFHRKHRRFAWNEIEQVYVKQYKAIRQFGGWGLRLGYNGTVAFTLQGRTGIYVQLKNGKKYLIGTNKGEKWQQVFREHGF